VPMPSYERYDEFPQIENGVGIVRNFLTEWEQAKQSHMSNYDQHVYLDVVCGVSAEKIFRPLLSEVSVPNLTIRLVSVENRFFGSNITVTGLLTGHDIINALQALPGLRTGVIIPGVALRKGEEVFLDDMKYNELEEKIGVPVRTAYGAVDLKQLLYGWR